MTEGIFAMANFIRAHLLQYRTAAFVCWREFLQVTVQMLRDLFFSFCKEA